MLAPGPPLDPSGDEGRVCCARSCCTASTTSSTSGSASSTGWAGCSTAASAPRPGRRWITTVRRHAGRRPAARRLWCSWSRGCVATVGSGEQPTAVLTDGPAVGRASSGAGPRLRWPRVGTTTRWSTASGRWPCARSSAAGSPTSPAPPPTRSRPRSPRRTPSSARGSAAAPTSSTPPSTATARPVRDDAAAVLELDDALAGSPMSWLARHRVACPRGRRGAWSRSPAHGLARPRGPRLRRATSTRGNPDGDGAQALARVLDDQGVEVDVVRSPDALDRGDHRRVDHGRGHVRPATSAAPPPAACCATRATRDLVVVAPGPELTAPARRRDVPDLHRAATAPVPAGCPAYDGLAVQGRRGRGLRRRRLLPRPGRRAARRAPAGPDPPRRAGHPHQRPGARGDNAAVALRLLGPADPAGLVRPLADRPASAATASRRAACCPHWLTPALWLLAGLAGVGAGRLARRRLGPLARRAAAGRR